MSGSQIFWAIWAIFMAGMVVDIWFRNEWTRRATAKLLAGQQIIYSIQMHTLKHACPESYEHLRETVHAGNDPELSKIQEGAHR